RFHVSKACCAAWIAGSTCSRPALWNTPTISLGFAGFTLLIFSVVLISFSPITMSYSRPSSARTLVSAAFMRRAFSALPKSVSGSFLNGVVGTRSVRFEISSRVAINNFLCALTVRADDVREPYILHRLDESRSALDSCATAALGGVPSNLLWHRQLLPVAFR